MTARDIAIIILLLFLAGFAVAYFVVGPGRRTGPKPAGDIPLSQRPYHSDEELEGRGLERVMAWGVALTLFSAAFLPVYWLLEPTRIEEKDEAFFEQDVTEGRIEFADRCASCHGSDAGGGTTSYQLPNGETIQWPVPALNNIVARYEDNENITDIERFITETVEQGRPGTPMPAWGAFYGGALNDLQVQAIVRYILSIQQPADEEPQAFEGASGEQIFEESCARCHGADAGGRVGPGLTDVFARYGDDGTPEGEEQARMAMRYTIEEGRIVPNYTNMPAWKDDLTDDAIGRVIDYLASIQEGQ